MPEPQTTTAQPTTDTSGQISYADMASKIRAKYPTSKLYKTKPDKELVEAWVQAKPERAVYAKRIKGYDPDNTGGKGVPSAVPKVVPKGVGSRGLGTELIDKKNVGSAKKDYLGAELPAAGGVVGGVMGGSVGATAGGAAGEALSQLLVRPTFLEQDMTMKQAFGRMALEGIKQGLLDKVGTKAGDFFFYALNKIPHAVIQQGIKLLPSDLGQGGKVMKYVEDLLTNLIPSAGTMAAFKESANKSVIGAADKLAKGFSRFRGTTEEMGLLLQNTYRSLEKTDRTALKAKMKTLANPKDIAKTAEYAEYATNFKNELANKIAKTNKPELIGGFLRSASSLQETRDMVSLLEERAPKVINATRTRIMQDVLQEALTGSKDPIAKQLQKVDTTFSGDAFKKRLDSIGEDKLKAIYGEDRYKAIEEFANLTKRVGSGGGNGAGKFLNLIFLLGPIRSGLTLASGKKIAIEGLVFNRAAKIITSTEGVKLYENYVRAGTVGTVKSVSAARDALKVYTQHSDEEYIQEQQAIEDQYYKDHPDELKYRNINKQPQK